MDKIFSTHGLHSRDRFDRWHEVACKQIVGHQSRPLSAPVFEAELQAAPLADLQLLTFCTSPMDVSRTRIDIARARSDELFVCQQLTGSLALEQQGREISLTTGDFCLLDPQIPYKGQLRNGSRLLVLKIPRPALEARLGNPSALTVLPLDHGPREHLASGYLASLPGVTRDAEGQHAVLFQEQALDLVAASLVPKMTGRGPNVSSLRTLHYLNLRRAVEQRLSDPKLSPKLLATAVGISVRYANVVLASHGTSLERFIQKSRLERCRRALEDGAQAHRSITDIAFSWGFTDLSQFSRSFKKIYGLAPRDYRGRLKPSAKTAS
jgi:AraC-like DNA-binding protein